MKKFIKVCVIAGIVCLFAGGGIATVAYAMGGRVSHSVLGISRYDYGWGRTLGSEIRDNVMEGIDEAMGEFGGGWNREHWDDYDYDDYDDGSHHTYMEEIPAGEGKSFSKEYARKLDLEVRWGSVVIQEDDSADLITVYCDAEESYWYTYSEGDELKVKVAPEAWSSKDYTDSVVMIKVPAGYRFESVDLEVKSMKNLNPGRSNHAPTIYAEGLKADKMELDAKVGNIEMISAETGELDVSTDVGNIEFDGSVTGKIDAECNVGNTELKLAGKKDDYNYEIKCRVGSINVDGESFSGLSSEKKINNNAGKKMELECNTGSITVEFFNSL